MEYLLSLRTCEGLPLYKSRRKTFILGFIATSMSVLELSHSLLSTANYNYILTIRFSQDHLESLFGKIRSMGGFNNNPSVTHFRSALKRLLCKQSISASQYANCLDSGSTGSVFKLEWSNRRSPLPADTTCEGEALLLEQQLNDKPLLVNILYYIVGFIVRSLRGSVCCESCSSALVENECTIQEHQYALKCYHLLLK